MLQRGSVVSDLRNYQGQARAVERDAVRRWIRGHRAAERRNLELMQREGPMSSEASFLAAMELCDLAAPVDSDPLRDREIEQARRLWAKLKKPWAARRA